MVKKLASTLLILILAIGNFFSPVFEVSAETFENSSSPVSLTVMQAPVSLTISPDTLTLAEGETQAVTVNAVYADDSSEDISESPYLNLEITNEAIATIADGTLSAASIGSTTLTATYGGAEQTAPITVSQAFDDTNFQINYTNPQNNGDTIYYEDDSSDDSFGVHYTLPIFNGSSSVDIHFQICSDAEFTDCTISDEDDTVEDIYADHSGGDTLIQYFPKGSIAGAIEDLGLANGATGYLRITAESATTTVSTDDSIYFKFKEGSISTDTTTGFQNNITFKSSTPQNTETVTYKTGSSTIAFTNVVHLPALPSGPSISSMTINKRLCTDIDLTNCMTLQSISNPFDIYGYNTTFSWATSKSTLSTAKTFLAEAETDYFYLDIKSVFNYSNGSSATTYSPNFVEYAGVSQNNFSNESDFLINHQSLANGSSTGYSSTASGTTTILTLGALFADYAGAQPVTLTEEACKTASFLICTPLRTYTNVYASYPDGIFVYNTKSEIASAISTLGLSTSANMYIRFSLKESGAEGEGPIYSTNYFYGNFHANTSTGGGDTGGGDAGGGNTGGGDTGGGDTGGGDTGGGDTGGGDTGGGDTGGGDTGGGDTGGGDTGGGDTGGGDTGGGDTGGGDNTGGGNTTPITTETIIEITKKTIEKITKIDLSTDKLIDDFYKVIIPTGLSTTREAFVKNMVEELNINEVYSQQLRECDQNLNSCFLILESKLKKKINPEVVFPDIADSEFKDDIITLAKLGFVSGTDEGFFQPDRYINRIEALRVITGPSGLIQNRTYEEAVALLGGEKGIYTQTTPFQDVNTAIKTNADIWWYPSYLKVACDTGIINCNQSIFQPHIIITPEEVSALIERIKKVLLENRALIIRNSDEDGEGLLYYKELIYGTDPENPDTDEDGLTDYEEIYQTKTNPKSADSDNDQISDGDEVSLGTNPNKQDSDGDGASDWYETQISKTNPLNNEDKPADTNNNGIADSWEITWGLFDKSNIEISDIDSDGDGLSNLEEYANGTDPTKADSDGDGLSDALEVIQLKTDPNKYTIVEDLEPKITNLQSNNLISDSTPFILGYSKPNKKIEITVKNDFGHEWAIGTTLSDEQGFFEFEFPSSKSLADGEYLISIKVLDEANKSVIESSPINVTIQNNIFSKPEGLKLGDATLSLDNIQNGKRILLQTNYPKFTGRVAPNSRAIAHWKSIIRSSSLIANSKSGEFTLYPPEPLEEGDHELIVYSVRNTDGAISDTIRVKFFVGDGASNEEFSNSEQALLLKKSAPNSKGGGIATIKNFFYKQEGKPLLTIFFVLLITIAVVGTVSYRRYLTKNKK